MKTITKLRKNFPQVEFTEVKPLQIEGKQSSPDMIEMKYEGLSMAYVANQSYEVLSDAVKNGLIKQVEGK